MQQPAAVVNSTIITCTTINRNYNKNIITILLLRIENGGGYAKNAYIGKGSIPFLVARFCRSNDFLIIYEINISHDE